MKPPNDVLHSHREYINVYDETSLSTLEIQFKKKHSINPFELTYFLSHKSKQSRHFLVFDILLPLCLSRRKISKYSEQENALEIVKYHS